MNDSEKRRRELLNQTRSLYSSRGLLPAVHPRYGSLYQSLYGEEDRAQASTLGIRTFLCFMLFAAFVAMDHNKMEIKNVDSDRVVREITTDIDVKGFVDTYYQN